MPNTEDFRNHILQGYTFKGDSIILGGAMLNQESLPETYVKIPLKTLNRHGLIAGATGTGKTKTLQVIAEQLSLKGIPVVLMDLKGDLSGIAKAGAINKHIETRHAAIGLPYEPQDLPVELMTISDEKGVRLRATVAEFGPVLISKILGLNDTQGGLVSVMFKYCEDNNLPLLDLNDFKKVLQWLNSEGKDEVEKDYGLISSASVSTIMRKVLELEQQGAERFFGEPSFDPLDFCRTDREGRGVVSIIRLTDIQDKPKLFSTFMLSLLAEIFANFPEEGDLDQPKLLIFIDEAHLIFNEATDALLDQIEAVIKLIRSKAVGIYFCTQNPTDVPDAVLSQLGLKVQHALRAFTAKDRQMIKKTAENYPFSDFYDTETVLTSMGTGEALITALDEKGRPTPLAATLLRAPITRMDILEEPEIDELVRTSKLISEYNREIDRDSAHEILSRKIEQARSEEQASARERERQEAERSVPRRGEKSTFEKVTQNTMVRQVGRTLMREVARGLLGALGVRGTARRR
jgi:uncharacterized protein